MLTQPVINCSYKGLILCDNSTALALRLGWDLNFDNASIINARSLPVIDADETISSYVGRNFPGTWKEKALDFIFGKGHCQA